MSVSFEPTSYAYISADGLYRYELTRTWDPEKASIAFIMLNPSTADAVQEDNTIRRCLGFARKWDCGKLIVGNLYAYRATQPARLWEAQDPIGKENNAVLKRIAREAGTVVVAWGAERRARERARQVLRLLRDARRLPLCLGTTREGYPRHPLYVSLATEPTTYWIGYAP